MTDREKDIQTAISKIGMTNAEIGKLWTQETGLVFDGEGCTEFYVLTSILAGNAALVPISNYAEGLKAKFKAMGRLDTTPTLGAAVFFDYGTGKATHTGRVVGIDKSKGILTTVEGNIRVNGIAQVVQRQYSLYNSYLSCYGHPEYTDVEERFDMAELWNAQRGSEGGHVKTIQSVLNGKMGAELVVDGDFGAWTENAVKHWQTKYGLTVNGIVGPETWRDLLTRNV